MERKLNFVHRQGGALGESWRVSAIVYHWKKKYHYLLYEVVRTLKLHF